MEVRFENNEFTGNQLLEYFKRVYGRKVNTAPFTSRDIFNWCELGAIPQSYGGHKIISWKFEKEIDNVRVIKVDGLDRYEIEKTYGSLSDYETTKNGVRKRDLIKKPLASKQRTGLYYDLLKANRPCQIVVDRNSVPEGAKSNQLLSATKRISQKNKAAHKRKKEEKRNSYRNIK